MGQACWTHEEAVARGRLIEQQLPLVASLARRYANRGERLEDLVQVGTIGLIKAVDRFEPAHGVAFTAFAVPNIIGEIKHHLRDRCGPIRIPRRYQDARARMRRTRGQLAANLQRSPTFSELAAASDLDERELAEAVRAEEVREPLTLTEATPTVSEEDVFAATDDRLLVSVAMRSLHRRERQALQFRYFGDMSQNEVAARLGVSQTQASRLIASGLAKLRADFEGTSRCAARRNRLHSCHGDARSRRGSVGGDRSKAAAARGEA
jgi:RNA polymerase sigma-B factor